ncbi:DUF3397 family protein [Liquorilactobacillus satsumensis]|uniref:DUF3397 family protein n=1 Tax=Liquorilactobacillus satsumensis TaxID=259059 RepID=UPI0039EB8BED
MIAMFQWYWQLVYLCLLWLIFKFWKKMKLRPRIFSGRIKPFDVLAFFVLLGIHQLSSARFQISLLPFIFLGMAVLGIAMSLGYALVERQLVYRTFILRYWRFFDIVIYGAYGVLLILQFL